MYRGLFCGFLLLGQGLASDRSVSQADLTAQFNTILGKELPKEGLVRLLQCAIRDLFCVASSHPAPGLQRQEGITRTPGEGLPVTVRILSQTSLAQGKSQVIFRKRKVWMPFFFLISSRLCLSAQFKFVFSKLSEVGRQRSSELEQILQPVKMASSGYSS